MTLRALEAGPLREASPLHELIRSQGARAPARLAVHSATGQLSYYELLRQVSRLMGSLRALPIRSGAPVGVCLPRGPRFVTATLAALGSGAEVVPIDHDAQPSRFGAILETANISTCLTHRVAVGDGGRHDSSVELPPTFSARGRWVTQVLESQLECPLTPGDTMLHTAAVESPEACIEIFWPLCVGAKVITVEARDARSRLLACQQSRATVMVVPGSALYGLLDFIRAHGIVFPPWLRRVLCTSQATGPHMMDRLAQQLGDHGCALHVLPGGVRLGRPGCAAQVRAGAATTRLASSISGPVQRVAGGARA